LKKQVFAFKNFLAQKNLCEEKLNQLNMYEMRGMKMNAAKHKKPCKKHKFVAVFNWACIEQILQKTQP
jgi:hypothetical protein